MWAPASCRAHPYVAFASTHLNTATPSAYLTAKLLAKERFAYKLGFHGGSLAGHRESLIFYKLSFHYFEL